MGTVKFKEVKKEIENLSTNLSSEDAQHIFNDIIFKKKVNEGLKDSEAGRLTNWEDFKDEIKEWYKLK